MAKQVVPFKLVDINTEQFATFEENFDPASSQLSIDFGVDFKLDRDQNLLGVFTRYDFCLLYTSPSPRDQRGSRMPSSA